MDEKNRRLKVMTEILAGIKVYELTSLIEVI